MAKIIVSYRRSDSSASAGRIFDRLIARYGDDSVFMDIDNIPFGTDFRAHIKSALAQSDIVIAVIGPRWAGTTGDGRQRIDDAADPVRVEVESALKEGIPVLPVLVDGATMPGETQLPDGLKNLAFINAAPVDMGRDFRQHMERLIRSMDGILAGRPSGAPPDPALQAAATEPPKVTPKAASRAPLWGGLAVLVVIGGAAALLAPKFLTSPSQPPPAPATKTETPVQPTPEPAPTPTVAPTPLPIAGVDRAGIIDETGFFSGHADIVSALNKKLVDLEAKSGVQLVIAILGAGSNTTFAEDLMRRWKIGGEKQSGILVMMFPERKGYGNYIGLGARGRIDNETLGLLQKEIGKRLVASDVAGAVSHAVDDYAEVLTGDAKAWAARVSGTPQPAPTTYRVLANVSGGVQNMRSGPATKYPVVVAVPAGATGIALGICRKSEDGSRPWCAANWRTYSGWISSCCIVDEKSGTPPNTND